MVAYVAEDRRLGTLFFFGISKHTKSHVGIFRTPEISNKLGHCQHRKHRKDSNLISVREGTTLQAIVIIKVTKLC